VLTTQRPAPLDVSELCDCARMPPMRGEPTCGQCVFDQVNGAPTVRAPGPDPVAAYAAKRRAIDALWRDADALWDGASESQRDDMVAALGADWRPRR